MAPEGTRRDELVRAAHNQWWRSRLSNGVDPDLRRPPPPAAPPDLMLEERARVAERWLRGEGLEIGALHHPMPVRDDVRVRYVDRMTEPELRLQYPELAALRIVSPDIVDDGETMHSLEDESVDFVIANHFIEHCQDPILAFGNAIRVVRRGGVVFMAVPDKRWTFDRARPVTSLEHVVRDHQAGPESSRRAHFEEWTELADLGPGPKPDPDELMARDTSIHFHVWTPFAFLELLAHCRDELGLPFDLSLFQQNASEFIVVLTRREDGSVPTRPTTGNVARLS